ncbi:hypothetical protein V6N13_074813 [Hibiscus sabdariffa]|uniref:Uncharacterized protein n=1 Tax=Hibiscus sabdariffa TaxID=183260 RepID=A0ABR2UA56_9ROSI
MFLLPRSSETTRMKDMMVEHENDIKWSNGLSFFSALTRQTKDIKWSNGDEAFKSYSNHQAPDTAANSANFIWPRDQVF